MASLRIYVMPKTLWYTTRGHFRPQMTLNHGRRSTTPDDHLRKHIEQLLAAHEFRTAMYLDQCDLNALGGEIVYAKIAGMRCLLIAVVADGQTTVVMYDRAQKMYVVGPISLRLEGDTILDGVLTKTASRWEYVFFDVLVYNGKNMRNSTLRLRQICALCFKLFVVSSTDMDAFYIVMQEFYALRDYRRALDSKKYHIEGVVFIWPGHAIPVKWNYPSKVRAILQTDNPLCTDELNTMLIDLLAVDGTIIVKEYKMTVTDFEELTRLRGMLLVECVYKNKQWRIAKPCIDHKNADDVVTVEYIEWLVEHPVTLQDINYAILINETNRLYL